MEAQMCLSEDRLWAVKSNRTKISLPTLPDTGSRLLYLEITFCWNFDFLTVANSSNSGSLTSKMGFFYSAPNFPGIVVFISLVSRLYPLSEPAKQGNNNSRGVNL